MSKTTRMPAAEFVAQLAAALTRRDGYIMGATGQDPKKWPVNSWWFNQYRDNPEQYKKALYWRDHARRVWDCNGLAEGIYRDYAGARIDSKARYNYAQWCDPKGRGMIPGKYRLPGAAVFWGDSASDIHHVAFLWKPVDANKPRGDWFLIEARGVMTGVVSTRLYARKPDFWGLMTKYFDYGDVKAQQPHLGDRLLKNGMEGEDVRELQADLIRLGYDCGKWGADGDFGDATELAVKAFQRACRLQADGEAGPKTIAALEKALAASAKPVAKPKRVRVEGGNCYVRDRPDRTGKALGVVHAGEELPFGGVVDPDTGWLKVDYEGQPGWISGKYGKLV